MEEVVAAVVVAVAVWRWPTSPDLLEPVLPLLLLLLALELPVLRFGL